MVDMGDMKVGATKVVVVVMRVVMIMVVMVEGPGGGNRSCDLVNYGFFYFVCTLYFFFPLWFGFPFLLPLDCVRRGREKGQALHVLCGRA
ncbi:hypothetical protein B0I37DRAFT_362464 [Chaetomium sp. MPI-CAGE-AT-0009]|nr:hypothetical protein B0I37DRAFT_362464 [Chaetomium sp. MPI-CAGE-AT-0009]